MEQLGALELLLDSLGSQLGAALVIVIEATAAHPAPHPAELLAHHTLLATCEVREVRTVAADHVYIAPLGASLRLADGKLAPCEPTATNADPFFESLAASHRARAVAIVLADRDAEQRGARAVASAGGLVLVRERDGGTPAQLFARIRTFLVHATSDAERHDMALIYDVLHERTGRDFALYRVSSVRRCLERRMHACAIDSMRDYAVYLEQDRGECELLFSELLVGATAFFREPDAFAALTESLLSLLQRAPLEQVIRVWVSGCSSGQEAYSIAIVLDECMLRLGRRHHVQIFATDLDARSLEQARFGSYPVSIAAEVEPERLARYFDRRDGDNYQIRAEIRNMVVFARHDLLADPPFTRVHLVACRNLLVYFDPALERRLLPTFHQALLPGGLLFLGSTDSPMESEELFDNVDRRWKIFRRREGVRVRAGLLPRVPAVYDIGPRFPYEAPQRSVFHQLLPPAVLVRPSGELVQVHGRTAELFDLPTGEPGRFDVLQMARGNLAPELASALRDVARTGRPVLREQIALETAAGPLTVDVRVEPVTDEALAGTLLVAFERIGPPASSPATESRAREAHREIERLRAAYEGLAEALEQSNLELRAANEQLLSANEELLSANDELNTARADAQSLNEELRAVNAELREKLEFISRQHVQLQTLLDTNRIAAVFVNRERHIQHFTQEAGRLLDLQRTDVGRPLAQVVPEAQRPMLALVDRVLQTLVPSEIEITGNDRAFVVRAAPYRTHESLVDGVVVSLCDVSRSKAVQEQDAILGALALSPTVVFALDRAGRIVWSCGPLFDHPASDAIGKSVTDLFPGGVAACVLELGRRVVELGQPQRERAPVNDGREELDLFLQPLLAASGEIDGINAVMTRYERRTP